MITTSPPPLGAPGRRGGEAGDRRRAGSPTSATRSSRTRTGARTAGRVRAKEKVNARPSRGSSRAGGRDRRVSDAIAEEMRGLEPRGRVVTIANGCDFDDFAGLEYQPGERFRITHTGSFFGKRDPRPFLTRSPSPAWTSSRASSATSAPPTASGPSRSGSATAWSSSLRPAPTSLELQRDSEALLLLIPEAGGRGRGVLSGKVFEYLAAERPILAAVPPDGAAAELIRETGAGVVAAPDDVGAAPQPR